MLKINDRIQFTINEDGVQKIMRGAVVRLPEIREYTDLGKNKTYEHGLGVVGRFLDADGHEEGGPMDITILSHQYSDLKIL